MPTHNDDFFRTDVLPILTGEGLFGFALRKTRDRDDAHDVVQRTSMRAWRFRHTLTPGTSVRAWVFTICLHEFCGLYNERRRDGARSAAYWSDPSVDQVSALDPESALDRAQEVKELYGDLETLTPEFRHTLLCRYGMDMNVREAAEALGMPPGTVMSQTYRGIRALRKIAV